MAAVTHRIDRQVVIQAAPAIVFGFLTESSRWAAWWGAGSEIDARPGGRMKIRYPDGTEATGEVIEFAAPDRIVFTYGYSSGAPVFWRMSRASWVNASRTGCKSLSCFTR